MVASRTLAVCRITPLATSTEKNPIVPDRRKSRTFEPLVRPLHPEFTPERCFQRLHSLGGCVWLDSNMSQGSCGRYSYLSADPFSRIRMDKAHSSALAHFRLLSERYFQPKLPDLPPMQGGWMGWMGYELGGCFENVPPPKANEFCLPIACLGLYDVVLCWDHELDQGWIVSQGWPAIGSQARKERAYRRIRQFLDRVEMTGTQPTDDLAGSPMHDSQLVPQYSTRWSEDWTSNFSSSQFRQAIRRCVDYIHAGDIFQVNLAQRLLRKAICDSSRLYCHLRHQSPAPFSGYADFGRVQVISSSPERFVQLNSGTLEARPIKGTRPRLTDPTADAGIGRLLETSEKDRSENIMIVDLLRNDLSRVADPNSIDVPSLCGLEKFPYVWHLVSIIRAQLQDGQGPTDVIQATFPGGSITGAPKIRAMEIVAELEPTARGPYCGSLGYISFAGDMDLNILIRTITACQGWWQVPVGGGIVADSSPNLEEQETWHKAEGILRAIDSLGNMPS